MDQILFMRSVEEKANKIVHEDDLEMLQLWLEEVKRIDDKMQSYCNDMVHKFETRLAAHCYGQCVQCDAGLSEPSHHANTPSMNIISSSSNQPKCINPPTMTDDE